MNMGIPIISESYKSLANEEIVNVQASLGIRIPDEIRKFYLENNGGIPSPHLFRKDEEYYAVHQFLPIKYGKKNETLEDIYRNVVLENNYFPNYLVPFAIDPGGDYFCFSLKENEPGAIYCYVNDYYDDETRSVVYLSPNIKSFLENLQEE